MNKIISLIVVSVCIAAFLTTASAQEKFDIVSFKPPAGWQAKRDENTVQFVTADKATGKFCVITLTRSTVSKGNSRTDFELAWKTLVADNFASSGKPEMGVVGTKNGWTAEVGVAPFENEEIKGAALLTTVTGGNLTMSMLALTNSEDHEKDIEAFVDSVVLPPPSAEKPSQAIPAVPAGDNARLIGRWQRSSSGHPTYADSASWGNSGYTKSRYEFNADGSYVYTERSFRMTYPNIIVVRENGKYSINGNILTISPARSTISSYQKAGGVDALGPLVKTQARPLERIAYRFTMHYFSGIQEWNLVLQADQPTQRDGQFSTLKVFENAWYFDQKFTNTDLTAARP